ncbi:LysM peptidoglycan-binding domain-containing protein [Georgenia sp. AZ-5]|uniref:LysM peptidoglycan-binding domain-containing protein n=1 Tax=Georgenia sp. AZ-5 TaxID=3367526 RepID=UPI003754C5B0
MSALVAQPAWQPAPRPGTRGGRRPARPGDARPDRSPTPRRGNLQLVGPGFVPPAAARPAGIAAPSTAVTVPVPALERERRSAAVRGQLRLTALGRRVVAAAVLLLAASISVGLGLGLGGAAAPGTPGEVETVTVAAGETLWTLAGAAAAPGEDVRDVVAHISELNALDSGELRAGQQLLVPAR